MAPPLTTMAQQITVNVTIYFNLIVEAKVQDPDVKAVLKGMGGLVASVVGLLIVTAESGGKVTKADAIRFAASHINASFQLVDQAQLNCATALVDLALAAEAAYVAGAAGAALNAVPVAGNTTYILLMTYNACAVLAAAYSAYDSCKSDPKVATLQLVDVRAGAYLTRVSIA